MAGSPVSIWGGNLSSLVQGPGITVTNNAGFTEVSARISSEIISLLKFDASGALIVSKHDVEAEVLKFLDSTGLSGWDRKYKEGITLNMHNEGFIKCDESDTSCIFFTPKGNTSLPYTTTGNWETESHLFFAQSGDTLLKQELSDPNKGAALVAAGNRSQAEKNAETVSIFDFGAIGDGVVRKLNSKYNSLEDAKKSFKYATIDSLERFIDGVAYEEFLLTLSHNGGVGLLGSGTFIVDKKITIENSPKGFTVIGSGVGSTKIKYAGKASDASAVIDIRRSDGVNIFGVSVGGGFFTTGAGGHCVAFRNTTNCKFSWGSVEDFVASGVYVTSTDPSLKHNYNFVEHNVVDGSGTGNNGVLFVDSSSSFANFNHVKNLSIPGTPSAGVQFKGNCLNCLGVGNIVEDSVSAFAFADEGGSAGDGPIDCHFIGGVSKNCQKGVLSGKATNCTFSGISIDHGGRNDGNPISVSGSNRNLVIDILHVYNLGEDASVIESRSHDITFKIARWDGTGKYLFTATSGVRNRVYLKDAFASSGQVGIRSKISVSGNAGYPDVYSEQVTQVRNLADSSILFLGDEIPGARLFHLKSSDSFNFRGDESSQTFLSVSKSDTSPGSNNAVSIGRANRLWTQVFASTTAINTSDARLKTPVESFTENEIQAAIEIADKIGVYKWLDSIETKGAYARKHIGTTVQTVIGVMEKYELNPFDYGFVCYDSWEDEYVTIPAELEPLIDSSGNYVLDEDGNSVSKEISPERKVLNIRAGNLYSFRGEMLDKFILKGISHKLKEQENRLAALERKVV